jgi:hypothetical protein
MASAPEKNFAPTTFEGVSFEAMVKKALKHQFIGSHEAGAYPSDVSALTSQMAAWHAAGQLLELPSRVWFCGNSVLIDFHTVVLRHPLPWCDGGWHGQYREPRLGGGGRFAVDPATDIKKTVFKRFRRGQPYFLVHSGDVGTSGPCTANEAAGAMFFRLKERGGERVVVVYNNRSHKFKGKQATSPKTYKAALELMLSLEPEGKAVARRDSVISAVRALPKDDDRIFEVAALLGVENGFLKTKSN